MAKRTYRLPSGETTTDADVYADAWQALGASVEWATGGTCCAFDPSVVVYFEDSTATLAVPVFVAQRMERLRFAFEGGE